MTLKKHLLIAMIATWSLATAQQATPAPTVPPSAGSQQQPGNSNSDSKDQKIPTVRIRSDEVNVVFTVVDKDGKFVRDLKQDQFRILDNKTIQLSERGMRPAGQVFNNRNLEKLFGKFESVKFFLTRDNLREVIVRR